MSGNYFGAGRRSNWIAWLAAQSKYVSFKENKYNWQSYYCTLLKLPALWLCICVHILLAFSIWKLSAMLAVQTPTMQLLQEQDSCQSIFWKWSNSISFHNGCGLFHVLCCSLCTSYVLVLKPGSFSPTYLSWSPDTTETLNSAAQTQCGLHQYKRSVRRFTLSAGSCMEITVTHTQLHIPWALNLGLTCLPSLEKEQGWGKTNPLSWVKKASYICFKVILKRKKRWGKWFFFVHLMKVWECVNSSSK